MSTSASPMRRLFGLRDGLVCFFEWWFAELAAMLPARLRSRFHLGREQVELSITDQGIELNLVTGGETRNLRTFSREESEGTFMAETVAAVRGRERRLVLQLPGHSVLVRELGMPLAVKENLAQVLRYEMDRYTPFKAESVYFGYKVLGQDAEQGRLRLLLAAVPREVLDHWLQQLQAWGVYPDRVEAEQARGVDLAGMTRRAAPRRRLPSLRGLLLVLLLAILLFLALMPLWKMREVVIYLNQQVAQAQQQASQAQDLRAELDRLSAQTGFVLGLRQDTHTVTAVLDELAKVLPDDTWAQSLQYRDGRLVVEGRSASASALIGRIEASPLFKSVSFIAPVTRDPNSDQEVFQIALDVRERQP